MSKNQEESVWEAFTEKQRAVIQSELVVVYTEVLNDFINSDQTTSLSAASDYLCPTVDRTADRSESRESVDAIRAA